MKKPYHITNRAEINTFLHFFTLITAAGSAFGFHQIIYQITGIFHFSWVIGGLLGMGVGRLMVIRTYFISDLKDTTKMGLFKSWAADFGDPIVGPVRIFGIWGVISMCYAGIMFVASMNTANEQISQLTIENYRYNQQLASEQDSLASETMEWYKHKNIMTYGFAPMAQQEIERKTQFAQRNDSLLQASISAIKTANTVNQLQLLNDLSGWLKIRNAVLLIFLCAMLALNVDGAVVFFARVRKKIDLEDNARNIVAGTSSVEAGSETIRGNPVESGNGGGFSTPKAAKVEEKGSIKVSSELEALIIQELKYQLQKSQRQISRDLECSHTLVNDINAKYGIRKNEK